MLDGILEASRIILAVFVVEIASNSSPIACVFSVAWNVFDFVVVAIALIMGHWRVLCVPCVCFVSCVLFPGAKAALHRQSVLHACGNKLPA
ncbi:hypothetical protein [Thiohalophilus sp.]|uniref:hypothetical protein n=1 Tax=Thiohalophilus sp. TaxID=3028392 RepID=UPI002ACD79E6|nr:hypothetical protein [Thiohalophilus sp.]MDZ7803245.1 hypothetical protein [Thiohalophilus sp.]